MKKQTTKTDETAIVGSDILVPVISGYCQGEKCFCGNDACHKVGEEIFDDDPSPNRHNLTSYVCCEHFQMIFGQFAVKMCQYYRH